MDVRKLIDRYLGIPLLTLLGISRTFVGLEGNRRPLSASPSNVLVIYLSGVGDTVMVSTCLTFLAARFPTARITFLASSQNRDIVKDNPLIARHLCVDTTRGMFGFLKSILETIRRIRIVTYDIVIDFEQFLRLSAIVSLLSDPAVSLGFRTRNQFRHHVYSHPRPFDPSQHTLENFVALLRPLGIRRKAECLKEIPVSKENQAIVENLMDAHGIQRNDLVIGMHPGSGGTAMSRRWAHRNFASVAERLIRRFNATILFTGSENEYEMIESIRSWVTAKGTCLNFAGGCTLAQLPHLIARCDAFVSNDTGPMHIAAAMKTPVVALFGPNSPSRYGPIGKSHRVIYEGPDCSPCILAHEGIVPECNDNFCMKQITVNRVWQVLERTLIDQGWGRTDHCSAFEA